MTLNLKSEGNNLERRTLLICIKIGVKLSCTLRAGSCTHPGFLYGSIRSAEMGHIKAWLTVELRLERRAWISSNCRISGQQMSLYKCNICRTTVCCERRRFTVRVSALTVKFRILVSRQAGCYGALAVGDNCHSGMAPSFRSATSDSTR